MCVCVERAGGCERAYPRRRSGGAAPSPGRAAHGVDSRSKKTASENDERIVPTKMGARRAISKSISASVTGTPVLGATNSTAA